MKEKHLKNARKIRKINGRNDISNVTLALLKYKLFLCNYKIRLHLKLYLFKNCVIILFK